MSVPNRLAKRLRLERKHRRKQDARLQRTRGEPRSPDGDLRFDIPPGATLVSGGAPGGIKMSEILPEFVKPFFHFVEGRGRDSYHRLLSVGVAAWNAALAPESKRQEMIDGLVRDVFSQQSDETQETFREIVDLLIQRKLKHFAQYRRPILNFSLQDTGNGYYLQVMSALE